MNVFELVDEHFKMQQGGKKYPPLSSFYKDKPQERIPSREDNNLQLLINETNLAKQDKDELNRTGQIKNPRSLHYKKLVPKQAEVKQDNISTEQRNAQLSPLQRPLIYLASPEKLLGDLGVPNMETSELDRQAIAKNTFNSNQTREERFLNNAKLGLGYVPEATINTALAAAFMPEGAGALGLVNETLNPLAGLKTSIPDSMRQGLRTAGVSFEPKFKSEIDWGNWNKEILDNPQLLEEYYNIEQAAKANGTWMKPLTKENHNVFTPYEEEELRKFKQFKGFDKEIAKLEEKKSRSLIEYGGTPEQFIQEQSTNFKKAYPNGADTTYRGNDFTDELDKYEGDYRKTIFTGEFEMAKRYNRMGENSPLTVTELPPKGLKALYSPKTSNKIVIDGEGDYPGKNYRRNYARLDVINQTPSNEIEQKNLDNFTKWMREKNPEIDLSDKVMTDHFASYMSKNNSSNPIDRVEFKKIFDGTNEPFDVNIHSNVEGNFLKSRWNNNGMFDMNNPNIYKSVVPIAGASYLATQGQESKQQGGTYTENEKKFLEEFAQMKLI